WLFHVPSSHAMGPSPLSPSALLPSSPLGIPPSFEELDTSSAQAPNRRLTVTAETDQVAPVVRNLLWSSLGRSPSPSPPWVRTERFPRSSCAADVFCGSRVMFNSKSSLRL